MTRGSSLGKVVLALLIGGVLGGLTVWAVAVPPDGTDTIDHNGDGLPDERAFYEGGQLRRVEHDRNFDGQPDEVTHYRGGGVLLGTLDDDFDGRPETTVRYLRGNWQSLETDRDGDGAIDYSSDAIHGVIQTEEWFDASGRCVKRVTYRNGLPAHGEIDADDDGILDTARSYNAHGEIESAQPIGRQLLD